MSIRLHTLTLTLVGLSALTASVSADAPALFSFPSARTGAVYTMTNDPDGNTILAYRRAADGTLKFMSKFSTAGRGSGGAIDPLGSQHSLLLSADHSQLFACNSGSGTVSVFRVDDDGRLDLTELLPTGGGFPAALAERGNLLYVLNSGGAGSINGFHVGRDGYVSPIAGASHLLGAANAGAASLDISPDGAVVAVGERVTSQIETFTLDNTGAVIGDHTDVFKAQGQFSLTFTPQGYLLDNEPFPGTVGKAAISSFSVPDTGILQTISASVPLNANGACWVISTKNGRNAYLSTGGSSTVLIADINPATGQVTIDPNFVSTGAGSVSLDIALTQDDSYLYALTAGTGTITGYKVGTNGELSPAGVIGAQAPASGQNGLAAY